MERLFLNLFRHGDKISRRSVEDIVNIWARVETGLESAPIQKLVHDIQVAI